mgnify:CR=1 FL=1
MKDKDLPYPADINGKLSFFETRRQEENGDESGDSKCFTQIQRKILVW